MAQPAVKQDTTPPLAPKTIEAIPEGMRAPQAPKRTIYQRMASVMKDVKGVGKDSHNPQGGYRYAGHEAVTAALREAYVKHGIVRTANVIKTEILDRGLLVLTVRVSWICDDEPTSRLDVEMPGLQSSVKKDGGMAPVQVGMALSYAVKNAEFKCFALTGDDTPDTEAADDDRDDPQAQPQNDEAMSLAVEYLGRFAVVRDTQELEQLKSVVRAHWPKIKTVRGIAERIGAAQRQARDRLGAREPGDEG